jgi:hypothetical protein
MGSKWIAVDQEKPKDRQLVVAFNDAYYEVCVFRATSPKGGTFQTHMGHEVKATHWMSFDTDIPVNTN